MREDEGITLENLHIKIINVIKSQCTVPSGLNIITTIHHPITRIKMFVLELIHTLKLYKIERKSTMICSLA